MKEHCRIFGIMARKAPVCVLFRRGPSKWTQLVKWDTAMDTFEAGNWFKGRVYERRSDISPNGKYLIYFASKINEQTLENDKGYTYAWTAISEVPHYKAIMLWPKGNCWHGGGLFKANTDVLLNHRPEVSTPHPKHVSTRFTVMVNPETCGEDEPLYSMRLDRDGWHCVQDGKFTMVGWAGWKTEQTEIWEKEGRHEMKLRRELLKLDFKAYGGPYMEKFSLIPKNGAPIEIPHATWADLDQKGLLVFARDGKVWRGLIKKDAIEERELIDLNPNHPPKKSDRIKLQTPK